MNTQEQMEFFHEIFDASLPRLGPGDDASTRRALDKLLSTKPQQKDDRLRILDIGCGNGAQTLCLARNVEGDILAVDNHQPFLEELNRRAGVEGLSEKIRTRLMDMTDLGPQDGIFDLIWSEGALAYMGLADGVLNPNGFRDGLLLCHDLLAPGGLMAASELCWFRPDPPEECRLFFSEKHSMATADANLSLIESCGFEIVGHFILPESCWRESFYYPLEERLRSLRRQYAADQERLDFIESIQVEIDIYEKYSSSYGYIFCLMRKP